MGTMRLLLQSLPGAGLEFEGVRAASEWGARDRKARTGYAAYLYYSGRGSGIAADAAAPGRLPGRTGALIDADTTPSVAGR